MNSIVEIESCCLLVMKQSQLLCVIHSSDFSVGNVEVLLTKCILTSLPVGTCFASFTLAKLPLPIVLIRRYLPMWGSSDPRLLEEISRGLALSSVACKSKERKK